MNNVIGVLNLHDTPHLGLLTEKRPLGTVTFLGRYALMDFTLSNFSNSGIDKVCILAEQYGHAIRNHVRNGDIWICNTKTGYQRLYINEGFQGNPKFNTDINNLIANIHIIEDIEEEYVVIAPSFFLSSMDFRPIIDAHIKSGCDVTMVYTHASNANTEFINCDALRIKNDKVISIISNTGTKQENDISLETYVINRKKLVEIVKRSRNISRLYSIRKMLQYVLSEGSISANAYRFNGYVAPILSLDHYVNYSLDLLKFTNRQKLFFRDWPIYTTTHNTPPALYGPKAEVKNSFIANGCIIKGTVENSIISRDVTIQEGAVVKDCILFTRTEVGEDVCIKYVLTDKNVKVRQVKKLSGDSNEFLYVKTGAII